MRVFRLKDDEYVCLKPTSWNTWACLRKVALAVKGIELVNPSCVLVTKQGVSSENYLVNKLEK